MPATHSYGLHPFIWNGAEQRHEPPPGADSSLDFRSAADQAVARQSSGFGFFSWPNVLPDGSPNPDAMPSTAIPLGVGDCRSLQPTTAQRIELQTRLGLSAPPGGATLIDAIADVLGPLADPTGVSGPCPYPPNADGVIEIHLQGHSRVWWMAFDIAEVFGPNPTGRANRLRDLYRADLDRVHAAGGEQLLAKYMGHLCGRARVSFDDADAWGRMVSTRTSRRLGRQFRPAKPETTWTDDFNRASLGAGWTSVLGTASVTLSSVFELAAGPARRVARFESDVSSSDHYCQLTQGGGSSTADRLMPCVRFSPSAATCYMGKPATSNNDNISKLVAGTETVLGSTISGGGSNGTYVLSVSGSSLTLTRAGVNRLTLSDGSITGNTRGGIFRVNSAGTPNADDFVISDQAGSVKASFWAWSQFGNPL